jgi:hypothetical protein
MREMHFKSKIAQLELSDLGLDRNTLVTNCMVIQTVNH